MRSTCSLPLIIGLVFYAKSDIKIMAPFLAGGVVAFLLSLMRNARFVLRLLYSFSLPGSTQYMDVFVFLPSCPLFFADYYYFLYFFIALNERKKWESGQKVRKPSKIKGFSVPTFIFKTGQKVGKSHFSSLFFFKFQI